MKTAILRTTFGICAGLCAVAATAGLQAGCDTRHVLGAIDGGPPAQPDGDGNLPDGATVLPDVGGGDNRDGAVLNQDGAILNQDGRPVVDQDGAVVLPTESWTGYVENYKFPSGSDVIKIAFASDGAGGLVGTMTLGSGTPPPPATDPNVAYPADLLSTRTTAPGPTVKNAGLYYLAEGFGYPMRGGTRAGDRLRASMDSHDLWRGWCALQTLALPAPAAQPGSCLPNWDGIVSPDSMTCAMRDPLTDQRETVDCGKLALCSITWGVCICDASACWAKDGGMQLALDINITGDRAQGSLAGAGNVHFTKDP